MDEKLALEVEWRKKLMEELLAAIGSLHFDGCVRFWDAAVFDY